MLEEGIEMIYCCEEHVELALEISIDEHGTAPNMEKLPEEQQLSITCEYCQNRAIYVVAN